MNKKNILYIKIVDDRRWYTKVTQDELLDFVDEYCNDYLGEDIMAQYLIDAIKNPKERAKINEQFEQFMECYLM